MSRRQIHPASRALQALLHNSAARGESFTLCQLRDELLEHPDLRNADKKQLYTYVRDQVNNLLKHGAAESLGEQEGFKRRHLFQLTAAFNARTDDIPDDATYAVDDVEPLDVKLRRDSEQLRVQMEASDLQLQAFQEIVEAYPDARDKIAPLFEQEKAQARALGEKLKAYAKVQQKLAETGGDA
ncbi:hypothetical protein QC823_15745 [Halomonas vilamensis]|uniref:Uncharacterized protein n=1 Tax=Vreelandella vilamensis TaxID=531309 RepID=A0ABU1H9U0_9GAMM|nr:hypothetical protein [Halomonas vilamensis]MDR5900417.1 hypothetical protein [Halomonas vilamensis]